MLVSLARIVALSLVLAAVGGCATRERLPATSREQALETSYLGIPDARFSLNTDTTTLGRIYREAAARRRASGLIGTEHMLAISGGGENGAFGAGLLNGWTERGDRPQFWLVTGVSTGALTAPFAFLGSRYDGELRAVYTKVHSQDIGTLLPIPAILSGDSVADSSPLAQLIAAHLTPDMVEEIGREYRRGRLLFIGTTNLDLGQPIAWNIGAIAASGHPDRVRAIRRILLASASIPGAFPPVMLNIPTAEGPRQEMHVDGGATTQVFLYPANAPVRDAPPAIRNQRRVAWIIRNGRTQELPQETRRGLLPIASRSISTMITANGMGDIYRMYLVTRRDNVDFNLAYISSRFTVPYDKPFDPVYMNALFAFGRDEALSRRPWLKRPPGYAP